jgi:hypothetical protein
MPPDRLQDQSDKASPRFYIASFREVTAQDDAANLRTNLRNAESICSAREFSGDGQWRAFHNMHADLRRLRMLLLVFLPSHPVSSTAQTMKPDKGKSLK